MNFRYLFAGIILTVILVAGVIVLQKSQALRISSTLKTNLPESEAKAKGPVDAPIQLIEYSDFECPACRAAIPAVLNLLQAYPEKIHFVFHHFPLRAHRLSPLAHQAAECAAEQNQFWAYHDRLYGEQPNWIKLSDPAETFLRFANELGLDLDGFAQCLAEERIKRRILVEKAQGDSLKISSTPTFFLNGERLVGGLELQIKGDVRIRHILEKLPQKKTS